MNHERADEWWRSWEKKIMNIRREKRGDWTDRMNWYSPASWRAWVIMDQLELHWVKEEEKEDEEIDRMSLPSQEIILPPSNTHSHNYIFQNGWISASYQLHEIEDGENEIDGYLDSFLSWSHHITPLYTCKGLNYPLCRLNIWYQYRFDNA